MRIKVINHIEWTWLSYFDLIVFDCLEVNRKTDYLVSQKVSLE